MKIEQVASQASYGAATVLTGGSAAIKFLGLGQAEWAIVGIICGIFLGFITLAANIWVTIHFKKKHLKILESKNDKD